MQRSEKVDLAKVTVTCKTCGVTESFYSDLSVEAFKLRHKGHEVEGGRKQPAARPRIEASPPPVRVAQDELGTKVSRVLVDLVEFPALQEPAFRVRGYVDGIDEAFVLTSPASQAAKLRELLAGGSYYAEEPQRALFTWEAYAVDYEEGVREKLEVDAAPLEEPPAKKPAEAVAEELELEPKVEAPPPVPERMAEVVVNEPEEEDYLLVSKSWYVQGGAQNRREAVRVSKALREFRWRVEPMYTLGVMLDDIVSIESARNEIGRELIQALEATGYRLTVVTAENGKVVAWFKKVSASEVATDSPAEAPVAAAAEADEEGPTGGDLAAVPSEAPALAVEAQPSQ